MTSNYHLTSDVFAALPPEWSQDLLPEIHAQVRSSGRKVVVLDDDPTGTQTVYDLPVLTHWSIDALAAELRSDDPAFYILTNSRSMSLDRAQAINREIGRNLVLAAQQIGRPFVVISRGDSTLRGHFPGEVAALASALDQPFDAWLLMPFFGDGGRYTIDDLQYVASGDRLIPAGETAFARDAAFGYRSSNLRAWVEEKTSGAIPASAVASITLNDLRSGGPARVTERLLSLRHGSVCIVNAASVRDLQVFVHGLLAAEDRGRRFLYRTAASFVAARAGIAPRPLLARADLDLRDRHGGLIVVGSHVPATTAQVAALVDQPNVVGIELPVDLILSDQISDTLRQTAGNVDQTLARGQDVMIYTSRALRTGSDAHTSLRIGQRVSAALVNLARMITIRPRYIIAKGGITSSDLATAGLGVRRAIIRGQIKPGVPVWQLGAESRFPDLPYIVFPGNVGTPTTLAEIVMLLRDNEEQ